MKKITKYITVIGYVHVKDNEFNSNRTAKFEEKVNLKIRKGFTPFGDAVVVAIADGNNPCLMQIMVQHA